MEALKPERALRQARVLATLRSSPDGLARTHHLSAATGLPCTKVRAVMNQLVKLGLAKRHDRYSYVNDIMWQAVTEASLSQGA